MTAVGVTMLVVAWANASGTAALNDQVAWAVLGVLGLFAVGAAMLSWVLSGRRTVRARRQHALATLDLLLPYCSPAGRSESVAITALVRVPGSSRYHRDDCLLVRGKKVARVPDAGAASGVRACEMCKP